MGEGVCSSPLPHLPHTHLVCYLSEKMVAMGQVVTKKQLSFVAMQQNTWLRLPEPIICHVVMCCGSTNTLSLLKNFEEEKNIHIYIIQYTVQFFRIIIFFQKEFLAYDIWDLTAGREPILVERLERPTNLPNNQNID